MCGDDKAGSATENIDDGFEGCAQLSKYNQYHCGRWSALAHSKLSMEA